MHQISRMDTESRRFRLREILRDKCKTISDKNIDMLLTRINVNRIYLIKTTRSLKKFLNIVTAECIHTPEKKTLSYIIPILGNFEPGHYIDIDTNKHNVPGIASEKDPIAALKMSVTLSNGLIKTTYTLVVYEPV